MNALEIKNLTKTFPNFKLDNLNLTLPSGCIMGLIGENGAGKSTTIKLILNMLSKDSGTITILGKNNEENFQVTKEDIGVVMDEVGIPDCFNAKQVGKIMKHTFQNWNSNEYARLLTKLSLPNDTPFKNFSRGMKMKLSIAIALSHNSKLLLLDEATSGLDPVIRDEVVEMLHEFTRNEQHSILISSHIVSDLEKLCDYIAFLHKGKLLLCEEKDLLLGKYGILHCTVEQLQTLNPKAIAYKKESTYGIEAIVLRDFISTDCTIQPINIEDLFLFMIKSNK